MKSYLHGRKIVSGPSLGGIQLPRTGTPFSCVVKSGKPASATVDAVREGDKVTRLIITCSCGEKIEVECLY